jgi:hypothetical protein
MSNCMSYRLALCPSVCVKTSLSLVCVHACVGMRYAWPNMHESCRLSGLNKFGLCLICADHPSEAPGLEG